MDTHTGAHDVRALSLAMTLVAVLTLSGCTDAPPVSELPVQTVAEASYKLGPGDRLRVITFGEPSLTGEFIVNEIGRVSLPLIGSVPAGGLTLVQFNDEVERSLSGRFLKNPRVSVEVLNYRPYYILGEVNKPGEYPFISGLTVTNAVATAGGFTYRANVHRVVVRGQRETREHIAPLTGVTPVHPGDTIRIPERLF